jgi:uncharacterized protein (TIGR00251 family)
MIQVQPHAEGCVVGVRAQPGARRNGLTGLHNGLVKVAVTAPADKGRANEAIEETLAESLGLKRSQVALLTGPTSREKKFLIRGIDPAELVRRVEALLTE